jgi:hypothetical protein
MNMEDGAIVIEAEVVESPVTKRLEFLKRFWAGFHNTIIVALLFSAFGVAIGVKECKKYYVQKIEESVAAGAMVYNKKLYTISQKP